MQVLVEFDGKCLARFDTSRCSEVTTKPESQYFQGVHGEQASICALGKALGADDSSQRGTQSILYRLQCPAAMNTALQRRTEAESFEESEFEIAQHTVITSRPVNLLQD